uniref:Uncharacterized protein n=1 Tax=Arundo donax TaxID=35708 RepID=A0A0A9FI36_ARUDO
MYENKMASWCTRVPNIELQVDVHLDASFGTTFVLNKRRVSWMVDLGLMYIDLWQ